MKVRVDSVGRKYHSLEKPLKHFADGVLKFENIFSKDSEVDVYLVDNQKMKEINKKFRNKNSCTDVVALLPPKDFPFPERGTYLGEVYLAPDYLRENKDYDINYATLHGLLHLAGFLHDRKSDKMEMEKAEIKILKWLNHKFSG